jgi:dipeptidyl aminopeptidase/acylaminoacyl peptidase
MLRLGIGSAILGLTASLAMAAGAEAARSPGRIVFVRNAGLREAHVWSIDPDGSGARQLTSARGTIDGSPQLSPDGRRIVFSRFEDGDNDLFIMGVNGAHERRLLRRRDSQLRPSFSPDGGQIVFEDGGTDAHVALVDDHGDGFTDLGVIGNSAEFSPSGDEIVFASAEFFRDPFSNDRSDIYVMDADGSDQRRVVGHEDGTVSSEFGPTVSPDGELILFGRYRAQPAPQTSNDLWTVDSDGTESKLTDTPDDEGVAHYSPDGRQIVYSLQEREGARRTQLLIMNARGGPPAPLTQRLSTRRDSDPFWGVVPSDARVRIHRIRVGPRGSVPLHVTCPDGTLAPCTGRAEMSGPRRYFRRRGRRHVHAALVVGSKRFRVPPGRSRTVRIKLKRIARRALRRSGKLRVKVVLRQNGVKTVTRVRLIRR